MQYTERQRAKILQGAPVAVLCGDEAPRSGYAALRQWATRLFEREWGGMVENPEIGPVVLNAQSVRDSMGHSMNAYKATAFAAIHAVLQKGVVIARGRRSKNTDSYFVAAPLEIGGKDNIAVVIVNRDIHSQRMYLHSVTTKENLLTRHKSEAASKLAEQNRLTHSGDGVIVDIAMEGGKLSMKAVAAELCRLLTLARL